MPRTPTATELAILDKLEPEAKAAWEAEELGLPEAIAASQALTDKRSADVAATRAQAEIDRNTISVKQIEVNDATTYGNLSVELLTRNDPDYVAP